MGRITQKSSNKNKISKPKRRHRRKYLDDLHSRILKTKRKLDVEKYNNEDQRSEPKTSKICDKYKRPVYAGIFRNGTKGKNVKKGKCETVVSEARLVGDALKLFDGESGTICISENTTENESYEVSNKELVKDNSQQTRHTREKSPVLGKKQRKNRTEYLGDTSKNKETEIVFEPIDIPEVVIHYNPESKRTMKEKERNKIEGEATCSEHSKITSRSLTLEHCYEKLCERLSHEFKGVLKNVKDPLLTTRRKLKEIVGSIKTENIQHETARKLLNSTSPVLSIQTSEYQACTHSNDSESSAVQFPTNQDNLSWPSENSQHSKKNFNLFNTDWKLSVDSNSWRDERCFDISILPNNSKLPPKKRYSRLTFYNESPTQLCDKQIVTVDDCVESNNRLQQYPNKINRSESNNDRKFSEIDFANMFQNLPTPSTVQRQFSRSKISGSRIESMKMKDLERPEEFCTDLCVNSLKKKSEVVQFRDCTHSQAPLEILTAAAAFVEDQHPPQTEAMNLFTGRYFPTYPSRSNHWTRSQPSSFYSLHGADSSNFNVEPAKQRHCCTSRNASRSEERHIYLNCTNCSHECNVSHQNHTETVRTTMASGYAHCPIYDGCVANNYVNLPNNVEHTRVLPFVLNHNPCTYPQQVDDHRGICLQKFTQPVKYFALDKGVNVQKIPVYINTGVYQHGDHGNCPTVLFCNKQECSNAHVHFKRCHDAKNIIANRPV